MLRYKLDKPRVSNQLSVYGEIKRGKEMGLFLLVSLISFVFSVHRMWTTEEKSLMMMPLVGLLIMIAFFFLRIVSMACDDIGGMEKKGEAWKPDEDVAKESCILLVLVWIFNVVTFLVT